MYIEDLNELALKISGWGIERNITPAGGVTAQDQISKMVEELAECISTLGKISEFEAEKEVLENVSGGKPLIRCEEKLEELREKLEDDYGDMVVCIIQAARISGTDLTKCLNRSWQDIKDRKGYMENGKFIKVED